MVEKENGNFTPSPSPDDSNGKGEEIVATPEMAAAWQTGVRGIFSMIVNLASDTAEAEKLVRAELVKRSIGLDDQNWAFEILKCERDVTPEEGVRMMRRYYKATPLLDALTAALQQLKNRGN